MSYGVLSGDEIAKAVARQREYKDLDDWLKMNGEDEDWFGWRRARRWWLSRQPRIWIDDFNSKPSHQGGNLGVNSYDLNISPEMLAYEVDRCPPDLFNRPMSNKAKAEAVAPFTLDMRRENPTRKITIPEEGYTLFPGRLYLGKTVQHTESYNLVPNIDGRSSIGRLGLACHVTAGRGDCSFRGCWTLELFVIHPVRIYPHARICQISYNTIKPGSRPYSGRYQDSREVIASRFHLSTDLPVP